MKLHTVQIVELWSKDLYVFEFVLLPAAIQYKVGLQDTRTLQIVCKENLMKLVVALNSLALIF